MRSVDRCLVAGICLLSTILLNRAYPIPDPLENDNIHFRRVPTSSSTTQKMIPNTAAPFVTRPAYEPQTLIAPDCAPCRNGDTENEGNISNTTYHRFALGCQAFLLIPASCYHERSNSEAQRSRQEPQNERGTDTSSTSARITCKESQSKCCTCQPPFSNNGIPSGSEHESVAGGHVCGTCDALTDNSSGNTNPTSSNACAECRGTGNPSERISSFDEANRTTAENSMKCELPPSCNETPDTAKLDSSKARCTNEQALVCDQLEKSGNCSTYAFPLGCNVFLRMPATCIRNASPATSWACTKAEPETQTPDDSDCIVYTFPLGCNSYLSICGPNSKASGDSENCQRNVSADATPDQVPPTCPCLESTKRTQVAQVNCSYLRFPLGQHTYLFLPVTKLPCMPSPSCYPCLTSATSCKTPYYGILTQCIPTDSTSPSNEIRPLHFTDKNSSERNASISKSEDRPAETADTTQSAERGPSTPVTEIETERGIGVATEDEVGRDKTTAAAQLEAEGRRLVAVGQQDTQATTSTITPSTSTSTSPSTSTSTLVMASNFKPTQPQTMSLTVPRMPGTTKPLFPRTESSTHSSSSTTADQASHKPTAAVHQTGSEPSHTRPRASKKSSSTLGSTNRISTESTDLTTGNFPSSHKPGMTIPVTPTAAVVKRAAISDATNSK